MHKLRRELKDSEEEENKYSMTSDGAIIITITTTMGGEIVIMEAGEIILTITMDGVLKTSITTITTVGVTITVGEIITIIIIMVGETITTKIKQLEDYGVMPYKELIGS